MAGVRDRIGDVLGDDGADPRWRNHLAELLYDGEDVRESVDVDDARVVVTTHRVLAFDPDADGKQFQQVQRPNVLGVTTGAESETGLLARGARWIVIGLVMALAGALIDMESIVGDVDLGGGAGGVGLGGVLGVLQGMLDLLQQLDDYLQLLGGLVMLLGVVALGAYLLTRDPRLVVEVVGDDEEDVTLPRPDDARAVIDRLEAAIFPDGTADEGEGPEDGGPDGDPLREA